MIFLTLLKLTAVVFNLRMLLSCFKDKTKYPFLQRAPTDETQPEASVWKIFPKKRYVFLVTLLIMCLIIILSWEPHSESSRNSYKPEDLEEVIVLKEVAYSVVETFFVGIVLPVILTNLIDSNYEEKDEIKTILI